jgi:archaellum biogenesis ATPase FlaH
VREGYQGLAIVRGHPKALKQRLGEAEATVLWLTDKESKGEKTVPPSLERIMVTIEEFIKERKRSIVLLDDVQYLISNTAFEGVIRFVRTLVDEVAEREAIFILSLDPEGLKPQERSILEREMEVVRS